MSEMSDKWDKQWSMLLTHCHGENVEAKPEFKANLLDQLKRKTAENAENVESNATVDQADDENWSRLMKAAYVPCHVEDEFKSFLLDKLKKQQKQVIADAEAGVDETGEDRVMRKILTRSYQPVTPRKAFETRLLDNLKDRQRNTAIMQRQSRRRTMFFSAASGIAAAAMIMFVVWTGPVTPTQTTTTPALSSIDTVSGKAPIEIASAAHRGDLRLSVPASAASRMDFDNGASRPLPGILPVAAFSDSSSAVPASFEQASFETVPASFANYNVADAFNGPALPEKAYALQNIEMNSGNGWFTPDNAERIIVLTAGLAFRSRSGMGHLRLSDGSLITVSPNALMTTSNEGLTVERGLALVSTPDDSRAGFRLHFPERDIAIEPGTDLAVMVESPEGYAEGGAPAPMIMVVDRHDSPGGLALARGPKGIGPLLAKQLYRLDRYVTPDLPSRALCDTECQDLDNFFKMETVREMGHPMASFAGGFAGDRDMSVTATILTPAGYSKRGDKWVAENYRGQQTIKLKYLSDSYFGFVNERRDLARDLALGSEVVIDGGDGKFYEITK